MPLETSYLASGAGTSAYNGTYNDAGSHGGTRYFSNGSRAIWWGGSAWYMSPAPGNLTAYYSVAGGSSTSLPLSGWAAYSAVDNPGPTLTANGTAPDAPGSVTFSSIAQTSLTVTLPSLPSGATSLKLQRSAAGANSYSDVATGQSGGATVNDTGLTAGAQYDYRAVSVNASGSTNGSAATALLQPATPAAPTVTMIDDDTAEIAAVSIAAGESVYFRFWPENAAAAGQSITLQDGIAARVDGLRLSTTFKAVLTARNDSGRATSSETTFSTTGETWAKATFRAPSVFPDGVTALRFIVEGAGTATGFSYESGVKGVGEHQHVDLPELDGDYCCTVVCETAGGDRGGGRLLFKGNALTGVDPDTAFTEQFPENERGVLVAGKLVFPVVDFSVAYRENGSRIVGYSNMAAV